MRQLFALLLASAAALAEDAPLTLYYFERPPLYYTENGRATGVYVEPVRAAAAKAGVALRWESITAARLFTQLQENREVFCSPGWAKTEKRLRQASFSAPYLPPPRFLVLTRQDLAPRLEALGSVHRLLTHQDYRLGQRENFSYGPVLDRLIEDYGTRVLLHRVMDSEEALQLIRDGLIDYAFTQEVLWRHLQSTRAQALTGLATLRYPDFPDGGPFHLMCTRQTPAALLARLNRTFPPLR